MKQPLKTAGIVLTVFSVLWDIVEFLALPALFVVIGVLNGFPWQYYAITIGGYIILFIAIEIAMCFIFRMFDKKYMPVIGRKFEKYFLHND